MWCAAWALADLVDLNSLVSCSISIPGAISSGDLFASMRGQRLPEVPEFSFRDLAAGGGQFGGFDVEGVLTEYVCLDGRFWGMVVLSAKLGVN